ncbi:MAG: winged helix-turn-helix domain-containing protein [Haloferacaceae archaeon]
MPERPETKTSSVENQRDDGSTSATWDLVTLLNDEYAREILTAITDEAKPAREIAEECGVSRPTVYRRLDRLLEVGLIEEREQPTHSGRHRKRFRVAADGAVLRLREDGFETDVLPRE